MQPKPPPGRGPLPGPSYQPPSAPPVPLQKSEPLPSPGNRSSGNITPGERGLQTSNQYLRTPIVRYSSTMRIGKLHPMRISLVGSKGETETVKPQSLSGGFDPPIVVQVTAPGALVTPTHQIIPLSGGEAQFSIYPLSTGKLKGAKVEFLSQGRKISEIALPMKANKGRLAKWLIFLGILLPFLINLLPEPVFQGYAPPGNALDLQGGDPNAWRQDFTVPNGPGAAPPAKNRNATPEKTTPPGKSDPAPAKKPETNEKSTGPDKSKTTAPDKTDNKSPDKKTAQSSMEQESLQSLHAVFLIALQPPDDDAPPKNPPPIKIAGPSRAGQRQPVDTGGPENTSVNTPPPRQRPGDVTRSTIGYRGEDAIWAWIRHKLHTNGYFTKSVPQQDHADELGRFFAVDRRYEITQDSNRDWSTSRVTAISLYYIEPALRLIYRVFIQFPKEWPMADLGYALFFIALGIIIWVLTGPNRRKIKGGVMDIRLAT